MFCAPEYTRSVSLRLSEILHDLGVNEKIVLKRRRACFLNESVITLSSQLNDHNMPLCNFGSNIEGTTTRGLNSDCDRVTCFNVLNIIQTLEHWEHGKNLLLMIRNDNVPPGYCMLQCLRNDAPLPYICDYLPPEIYFFREMSGNILLSNNIFDPLLRTGIVKHGPAQCFSFGAGISDVDSVYALTCKTWPVDAKHWLSRQGVGEWPTKKMRKYCSTTGCLAVPVGHKCSTYEELEWRISTSHAERFLMFCLNVTQLRCYVLMKMIVKAFITPYFEDTISSFMCKTLLFYCIENTQSSTWRENNLLGCLTLCLFMLHKSVETECCPHFIIHGNNLIRGKISREIKPHILGILNYIVTSEGRTLLGIKCDDLGEKLKLKLSRMDGCNANIQRPSIDVQLISGSLLFSTVTGIRFASERNEMTHHSCEMALQTIKCTIIKLLYIYNTSKGFQRTACRLLAPLFCSRLGSVLASLNIRQYNGISQQALSLISMGLNSDVSSGKLKLASMLYCVGDINGSEVVLSASENNYDLNLVEPACGCFPFNHNFLKERFTLVALQKNEEAIAQTIAYCVRFMPCEIHCIPKELQYEMFRSTQTDLAFRGIRDSWMDCAVVDSLPFLYFLQYKTYGYLGRQGNKERALNNLWWSINHEANLAHRETALNLLGQCMKEENRYREALNCYLRSLKLRSRNNAAIFHICILLSAMINGC